MLAVQIAEVRPGVPNLQPLSDPQVRGLIRQKLMAGTLCEDIAHLVFGGISEGHFCSACGLPIDAGSTVIDTHGIDRVQRRFHPKCHLLLSLELEDLAQR